MCSLIEEMHSTVRILFGKVSVVENSRSYLCRVTKTLGQQCRFSQPEECCREATPATLAGIESHGVVFRR